MQSSPIIDTLNLCQLYMVLCLLQLYRTIHLLYLFSLSTAQRANRQWSQIKEVIRCKWIFFPIFMFQFFFFQSSIFSRIAPLLDMRYSMSMCSLIFSRQRTKCQYSISVDKFPPSSTHQSPVTMSYLGCTHADCYSL